MKGLFLNLRKPELKDMPTLVSWFRDPEFTENVFEIPENDCESYVFSLLNQNAKDTTRSLTLIAENPRREPIGLILYQNLDWKNRNIEMNNAIGNFKNRHALYGADLYLLGLTYAFTVLNMHKVYGYTHDSNVSAKKLNQFAAKTCGVLSQHIFRKGVYLDVVVFSILKRDFVSFLESQDAGVIRKFIRSGMFVELIP